MKQIKLYFCLLALTSLFSCNEYLDIKPKNMISLETIEDVKSTMSSYFYGITGDNGLWTRQEAVSLDRRKIYFPFNRDVTTSLMFYSDNIIMEKVPKCSYTWDYYKTEYRQAVNWKAYRFSDTFWDDTYHNIGYFNMVLDALTKFEDQSSDEYLELYCEAKMLRTLMFFNILKFYAPYNNDEYGIPITIHSTVIEGSPRTTQIETYKFLLEELNSLEKLNFNSTSWNVFYSKNKLSALLSQIYWFKAESIAKDEKDWKNAADYANKALEGKTLANTPGQLKELFTGGDNGFKLNSPYSLLIVSNGRMTKSNDMAPFGNGEDRLHPRAEFASLYDENDIRKTAFYTANMAINKWSFSFWGASNVVPMWRTADLHLIAAESYARQEDNATALKYLNDFKKSRISGYTSYQGNDLLDEILRERRKEFCYEFGYRWIDLKRINKGFKRMGFSNGIEKEFTLEENDYRFALPIPQDSELGFNKNITQNPGWPL